MHQTLCGQFKNFQEEHRPSPNHRRLILFPQDEVTPRFMWYKYDEYPHCTGVDLTDFFERQIPGGFSELLADFDSHRELGRKWNTTFRILYCWYKKPLPINKSLVPFLGRDAARWTGPIICMAPTKYAIGVDWDDWDEEDKELDDHDVMIPYDLDTTSLNVHVACLRFMARYEHTGRRYDIKSKGVGDGFDPK